MRLGPRRLATALGTASLLVAGALLPGPVTAGSTGIGSAVRGPQQGAAAAANAGPPASTYRNPVSKGFADTVADPSVIRGKDGFWYAYGTSDPLREGEGAAHRVPIARSSDLVHWTHVGDAFTDATLPSWATPDAGIWAPDIRYVDGEYRLYYVVTRTTVTSELDDNAVGMATAPTPTGPWADSGAPLVGPRRGGPGNNFLWTFDPTAVTDTDGSQWLFYGSYYGGVFVVRLADDGRTTVGNPTMVAIDNKFEGAYVVRHGGWWYLFASTANCCAGPTTGYSVQVGRSHDLRGPYVDRGGSPLTASRAGGTPVLTQNGNRFIGAGHNAVATDLAGQDFIVYHAIDRADPYLDGTDGINERPMLLDRLDWVDGWPQVRGGRGPSAAGQRAPVTGGATATDFSGGIPARWRQTGSWSTALDGQSGRYARAARHGSLSVGLRHRQVRVEADLRSTGSTEAPYGLLAAARGNGAVVRAVVDPGARRVRLTETRHGRRSGVDRARLPRSFASGAWHSLTLEIRGRTAHARLTHARLGDPLADLRLRLHSSGRGRAGAFAGGPGAEVDNLSALRASHPRTALVRDVVPRRVVPTASDEFAGPGLGAGWTWVRQDAAAQVSAGALRWPTQAGDLVGTGNDAAVLLREPPADDDWTIQTKLTIDLGTTTVRNFQQAGLVAYVTDDLFARFSHVAIFNTRQTEFGKEMPFAGRLSYGGTITGPPARTTWLRLTHRLDPSGEHELRAWSSRDGVTWVRGGVWTLPASASVRVGLISHGGVGATARFHYFRSYH